MNRYQAEIQFLRSAKCKSDKNINMEMHFSTRAITSFLDEIQQRQTHGREGMGGYLFNPVCLQFRNIHVPVR